jgi:hypothetical protein
MRRRCVGLGVILELYHILDMTRWLSQADFMEESVEQGIGRSGRALTCRFISLFIYLGWLRLRVRHTPCPELRILEAPVFDEAAADALNVKGTAAG